jgi:hypothetical protein
MDFGQLKVGIDFRFDSDKIVFAAKLIEERAEIAVHRGDRF